MEHQHVAAPSNRRMPVWLILYALVGALGLALWLGHLSHLLGVLPYLLLLACPLMHLLHRHHGSRGEAGGSALS